MIKRLGFLMLLLAACGGPAIPQDGQGELRDLPAFLEAMAAWVEDMEGYYQNRGEELPDQPRWRTLGEILLAARVYE